MPRIHITQNDRDLGYWAYTPDHDDRIHSPMVDRNIRKGWQDELSVKRKQIREQGFKATKYGHARQADALKAATEIENATGIAMMLFKHDYL